MKNFGYLLMQSGHNTMDDDYDDWSKCVMMFACAWSNVQSLTSLPGNKSFLCFALLRCGIPSGIQRLYLDEDYVCFLLSFRYKIYNCSWHRWGPQTNSFAIILRQVVFNSRLNQKKSVCLPQLELMLVQDLLAHCALCLTSFLLSLANLVWNNSLVSQKPFLAIQWGKGIDIQRQIWNTGNVSIGSIA